MKMPFYEFEILDDAFQFDFFSISKAKQLKNKFLLDIFVINRNWR